MTTLSSDTTKETKNQESPKEQRKGPQRIIAKGVPSRGGVTGLQPGTSLSPGLGPPSVGNGEGIGTLLQYPCLENPMDGGAGWAAVHGVTKSRTRLSDFTFTFHFRALEKEMAPHSSVLAWRIPGTGEPGGLPSMWSQSRTRLKQLSSSSSRRIRK